MTDVIIILDDVHNDAILVKQIANFILLVFYKQTCLFAKSDPPFASNLQDFENLFNQPFNWETCSEFCAGLSHLWSPNIQNIIL